MQTLTELSAVMEQLASMLPDLGLDADEQEKYSTMLLRLQIQVETGTPSKKFVKECLAYFKQVEFRAA